MNADIKVVPFLGFIHDYISKSSKGRVGPKGYPVRRFVASAEVLDHQNEIVSISGLIEVIDIMKRQGGRIQGIHTNKPTGEFFEYGLSTIKDVLNKEVLAVWVDIEVYDDYPSQKETLRKIDLPIGDKDRINGLSLGGTGLEGERLCDDTHCWNALNKFEGWEFSTVDDPACPIALQIEEYDVDGSMQKLQINTSFDNIYTKEGLTVTEAENILKQKNPQGRDAKTGKFSKKTDDDCECGEHINKMTPEEEKKMQEASVTEADDKTEAETEPSETGETPTEDGEMEEEPSEPMTEEPMTEEIPSDEGTAMDYSNPGMSEAYGATGAPDVGEEVNMKLDRLMSALNISKGDEAKLMSTLDAMINKIEPKEETIMEDEFVTINGTKYKVEKAKPKPPEVIEQDGKVYRIVKENTEEKPEVTSDELSLEDQLKVMNKTMLGLQAQMTKKEIIPEQGDNFQKEAITKSEGQIVNETIAKSIKFSKENDIGLVTYSEQELEYRLRVAPFIKDVSMETQNMFYQ